MLSHPLDSDSDCSDNEDYTNYASVIQTKLSKLNVGSAEEGLSGDHQDIAAKQMTRFYAKKVTYFHVKKITLFHNADFILSFVSHKVLSCKPVRSSYEKIKSPLEFAKNTQANSSEIEALITKQREINDDLKNYFLFMPVVPNTLQQKYDEFNCC